MRRVLIFLLALLALSACAAPAEVEDAPPPLEAPADPAP
ncbi:lipoprotein, partial [Oscillibacter sp.]